MIGDMSSTCPDVDVLADHVRIRHHDEIICVDNFDLEALIAVLTETRDILEKKGIKTFWNRPADVK